MIIDGGCYCGALRYHVEGDPIFQGQCHCRECQYISGGHPNAAVGLPEAGLSYTKGTPSSFARTDLDSPVSREFCGTCGTHILAKSPGMPGFVILKVGTFDDPSLYEGPQMAIFTGDKQAFHHIPDGIAVIEGAPG